MELTSGTLPWQNDNISDVKLVALASTSDVIRVEFEITVCYLTLDFMEITVTPNVTFELWWLNQNNSTLSG